jgi:hypothetical protein
MKTIWSLAVLPVGLFLVVMMIAEGDARGRADGYPVGGYISHGRGGHYMGGH